MNVLIVVFSPAGSTLKVAGLLERRLVDRGHAVQLLNITGRREIFADGRQQEFLAEQVKAHDVICLGSPVYEKHVEYYMREFIKGLPRPDAIWGRWAVPFFTYGGISSGVALSQAHKLLEAGGRQVLAAMKIESAHLRAKKLKTCVNAGLPGDEALPYIDELAGRIAACADSQPAGLSRRVLNYQGFREKFISALLNERFMHRHKYGKLTIDRERCVACSRCVAACPIQRIEWAAGKPNMDGRLPECIHCLACVNACPLEAISFVNGQAGWAAIERVYARVAREGSLVRSNEQPRNAVYPLVRPSV
ncbi:MAG: NADH-quinone oxidoreductase subunit I [Deltaproteobacteria bacterium ADurb.Bin510]|nr:MAG: NADH-quinone oxidoreductase subunit I [Deltaproteobacteria bacterium ADurb.Bin510]